MLDLHEILDISETGVAVQCASPLKPNRRMELCLDLAEARGQIYVTGEVIWSDPAGRAGFSLPSLPDSALRCLREWLFLNAMAAAANAAAFANAAPTTSADPILPQDYSDTLPAASAVQREAESLGSDLSAVLSLIASRSQSLLRASGVAIALLGKDADTMICRASSGESAPPVGAVLQVGSGFSGECVRTGRMLRCDDAETDELVDRQICHALGIRSILAAPVRMGDKVIALLEVFSAQPGAFGERDSAVLQRFAETILATVRRDALENDSPVASAAPSQPFSPQGSVLFASRPEEKEQSRKECETNTEEASGDDDSVGGIRLPRAHLYLLISAAATIALALGFVLAPWMQPWVQRKLGRREHTAGNVRSSPARLSVDSANPEQLRELARQGDPAAENALGLLYAQGDAKRAVKADEAQAAQWFTKAAEQNYVPAQSKLGALYWGGRGVPPSLNQAYFWTVLARAGGDQGSKTLALLLASRMTHAQAADIEQRAEIWYQQHESAPKAQAAR
jgi:putative methionine-R-sulfoxide reductase with GAF domain